MIAFAVLIGNQVDCGLNSCSTWLNYIFHNKFIRHLSITQIHLPVGLGDR